MYHNYVLQQSDCYPRTDWFPPSTPRRAIHAYQVRSSPALCGWHFTRYPVHRLLYSRNHSVGTYSISLALSNRGYISAYQVVWHYASNEWRITRSGQNYRSKCLKENHFWYRRTSPINHAATKYAALFYRHKVTWTANHRTKSNAYKPCSYTRSSLIHVKSSRTAILLLCQRVF